MRLPDSLSSKTGHCCAEVLAKPQQLAVYSVQRRLCSQSTNATPACYDAMLCLVSCHDNVSATVAVADATIATGPFKNLTVQLLLRLLRTTMPTTWTRMMMQNSWAT